MYGSQQSSGLSTNIPAPYLAEMELPELENIDVKHVNSLFKNAPHLSGLEKQMCTPKFLRKLDGYIGQKKAGKLREYQVEYHRCAVFSASPTTELQCEESMICTTAIHFTNHLYTCFQDYCVEKVASGDNFVFVAPTGAGKTKIFVEAARY